MPERLETLLQTVEYALLKFLVDFHIVLEICLLDLLVELLQHFYVSLVLFDQVFLKFKDLELIFCDGHLGSSSDIAHINWLKWCYATKKTG